jgi:hypothetical protein
VKITGISITLLTMLAFLLCISVGATFAMGANGGPLSPPGDTRAVEEGTAKGEKKVDKSGEGAPSGEKAKEKTGQPSPKKEPRIKYRDMYECGC